jgi:hypothetical protein
MTNNRHHCVDEQVCNCEPTEQELLHLGFEKWQISLVKRLPVDLQWEAHDEFVRRLMSDDDVNEFNF